MSDKINGTDNKTKALSELEKAYPVPDELKPENIEKMLTDSQKADKSEKKITAKRIVLPLVTAAACIAVAAFGFEFLNNKTNIDTTEEDMSSLSASSGFGITDISEFDNLQVLSDYSEIKRILNEKKDEKVVYDEEILFDGDMTTASANSANDVDGKSKAVGGEDYSETYTQVNGIDEADAIKTDGENVYYILNGKLYFAKLDREQVNVVKKIKLSSNEYFSDGCLYLSGNILTAVYSDCSDDEDYAKTYVKSYDISDVNDVKELSSFSQDGEYTDSRMKDNYLYLVTDYSPYWSYEELEDVENVKDVVPSYTSAGENKCLEPSDIYKPMGEDYLDYSIVSGLDVTRENMCVSSKAYMNSADALYMNDENIYMTFVDYSSYYSNSAVKLSGSSVKTRTNIVRFSVSDGKLKLTASKRISGSVLNQYSMDEYESYFRAAITTQTKNGKDTNSILIFNDKLEKVGEITDIAKGESIKSATFEGDRAYVVTYEQTDPLFTFDLSDPENPKILSELKALGYSTHLRAFKDDLMIGFGVEADKDGFETGLKLSMYKKNENGNTEEIDSISFGNYNENFSSDAVYDSKALLIDGEKNIIALPFYKYNNNTDKDVRGFKVLSYGDNGFEVKNTIIVDSSYVSFDIARIIYSGDYLYAFADNIVTVLDLNGFKTVNTVDLKK